MDTTKIRSESSGVAQLVKQVDSVVARSASRNASYVQTVLATYIPAWLAQRTAALYVDPYLRGETPFSLIGNSQQQTAEREKLKALATTPYVRTILHSATQALNITGFRVDGGEEDDGVPEIYKKFWIGNRMEARQNGIWRPSIGYGAAYTSVLPGPRGLSGKEEIIPTNFSPKTMTAFFAEPQDEWPILALNGVPQLDEDGKQYFMFTIYDDEAVHFAIVRDLVMGQGEDLKITYLESRPHGVPVCPIVYHTPLVDDDGGSRGEMLPILPIIHRLDQSVYDRLLIQRQAAWKTRTIANIETPKNAQVEAQMRAGDLLTSSKDAKFGTLDASSMLEHVETRTSDLKDLATASQTPSYMVTGESTNIQAEGLAAITSGYNQKIDQYKRSLGTSVKQMLQLAAYQDPSLGSPDADFEVRWADPRPYSLTQVADALGKLSQQLQIDPSLLYEQIPFFSDNDRAKAVEKMEEAKDEALAMAQADAAAAKAAGGAQGGSEGQAQRKREAGTAKDSNQNSR